MNTLQAETRRLCATAPAGKARLRPRGCLRPAGATREGREQEACPCGGRRCLAVGVACADQGYRLLAAAFPLCLRPSSRHVMPRPPRMRISSAGRGCFRAWGAGAAARVGGGGGGDPVVQSAGLGARPCRGPRKFSFQKGPIEPVAERQDEFPPWGDGRSECWTPAHRSRDGERSRGSETWEGYG